MAVNLPNIEIYYDDLLSDYNIRNYNFDTENPDDLKNKYNMYYDTYTGQWYKDFTWSDTRGETTSKIPILMNVTTDGTTYHVETAALCRQRTIDEMIDKTARAMGLEFDKRGIDGIKKLMINQVENQLDIVPTLYKSDVKTIGVEKSYNEFNELDNIYVLETFSFSEILTSDPDLCDWIYENIIDLYGKGIVEDISNKYSEEQITRPTGENVLTPYAKENLQNAVAALVQDGKMHSSGFSADELYNFVNDAILNSNDADVLEMLSHDNFRIMTRSFGGHTLYIDFIGYDILNNIGVVSNTENGQNIGVTLNGGSYVLFYIDSTHYTKEDTGGVPTNYSTTLRNYQYGDFVSNNGFTTGPHSWSINDTIGISADRKPYDLTPNYIYPSTPPHYEHITDIDVDPDKPTPPQEYWIIGIPNPNPVIKIVPSPYDPPIIPKDTPSDPTTPEPPTTNMLKGMCNVYKPNDTQVTSLNTFLWTDSTIDDLTQLWKNNPLEGVVAYHELYFDAETFGEKFIKLGTVIASDVGNVPTVAQRFQTLHCGYRPIKRYFNDKRDYDTKISVYLPFIGIRELDTNEIMDSDLYIDYNIDVVTGDCTANLSVNRKTSSGTTLQDKKCIAMFDGNCSSPIPLSSADRSRLYSSILSGAVGVVGSLGNPIKAATGLVTSALSTATQHQISIQKSGNIGGNKGAMAFKKPYLIIERPIPVDASERGKMMGRPCNYTVKLNNVSGYTECKAVHVETITNATDTEKEQIENILKSGIIL